MTSCKVGAGSVRVGLALACVACGGGTEPRQAGLSGTYALDTVDGRQLPVTTDAGIDGSRRDLVSGKIEFRSRSRLLAIANYQYVGGVSDGREVADTNALPYSVSGSLLLITRAEGASTTRVDTATITGGGLVLVQQFTHDGGLPLRLPATYVKVQ